jgi:lactoylglutathione lyase
MTGSTKPEANVKAVVPFFCVSDMERSLRYYVDGLGFTRTNQWIVDGEIRWCWLQLGGAALMLQTCAKKILDTMSSGAKLGQGVSLWFQCEDAIAIYHDVRSRGIEASEPQVGNGLWDTMLSDPDGYRLHFESPTDVPEEIKLSEVQPDKVQP